MTQELILEKNDIITLKIESFGAFGEGVSHVGGMAIFVPYACPNEVVEAHVLSVKKGYAYAKLLKVIDASPNRREPNCEYFYKCGGCDLQHVKYNTQLDMKIRSVKETLKRVGGVDTKDVEIVSSIEYGCRNKLTLPFTYNGEVKLGFYSERSHRVVAINACPLSTWSEKVISIFKDWANESKLSVYDENSGKGVLRALSVRVVGDKFMFTLVVTTPKFKGLDKLSKRLKEDYPDSIFYLNVNYKKTNVVMGEECILVHGEEKLQGEAIGVKYSLSPLSFSQVNDEIRDRLYEEVLTNIDDGSTVVDAYSGAGVMSVLVSRKATHVYGIEIVKDAVKDADVTAIKNEVSDKITNTVGDCAQVLPPLLAKLRKEGKKNINLILDPPRKGCDNTVLQAVLRSLPDKIVYVSCNPATLARDLKILSSSYIVDKVKLFDMFPQTKHVETLVCLSKKTENISTLTLSSAKAKDKCRLKI